MGVRCVCARVCPPGTVGSCRLPKRWPPPPLPLPCPRPLPRVPACARVPVCVAVHVCACVCVCVPVHVCSHAGRCKRLQRPQGAPGGRGVWWGWGCEQDGKEGEKNGEDG